MRTGFAPFGAVLCLVALATGADADQNKPQYGTWGVDLTSLDRSVKPGNDFFLYANGSWLKRAHIPSDRTSTGSFDNLEILSETQMGEIMAALEAKPAGQLTDEERKLRDFYDAYLDTAAIEAKGLEPAKADLARLGSLRSYADVARAMGSVPLSTDGPYGLDIEVDAKNPKIYSVKLGQSGLGMPDRNYYLRNDPELAKAREAYKRYLAQMLGLLGAKDADARAARVFALETAMAKVEWDFADRRDADKTYNKMTVPELKSLAPEFPWDTYLHEANVSPTAPSGARTVIVGEKSAFPPLAKIFLSTPIPVWRDYLTVHYLHSFASALPKRFDDANFAFYGVVLEGRAQQLPRPKRAAHALDDAMGEALGKLYVARFFPPASKQKAEALVGNLMKTYESDIRTLPWMTEATREKALDKLRHYTLKIGYPNHWRDYSALKIARSDLLGDVQQANVFEWNRELKRLDGPVDKSEWGMSPQTVNAYYNPLFNEIVFPAAILQPPFFDPHADDAVNYGAVGAVIGHEISHGFDDQGSKYDAGGALANWWTKEDRKNFTARTDEIVTQYNSFEPLPGLHIIGRNTLGENIADLAGLAIALKAYHLSLGEQSAPVIDGFTGDQRFFLGYAQVWRTKMQDAAIREQTLSNEHSVDQFRVIGVTRNIDAWYEAFNVQSGDKYFLAPESRVKLW